jgi:hypothetical protein
VYNGEDIEEYICTGNQVKVYGCCNNNGIYTVNAVEEGSAPGKFVIRVDESLDTNVSTSENSLLSKYQTLKYTV